MKCPASLAHNGSGVVEQTGLIWHLRVCVNHFRSMLKPMRFHGFHWLQKLGSGKTSFGAKVV